MCSRTESKQAHIDICSDIGRVILIESEVCGCDCAVRIWIDLDRLHAEPDINRLRMQEASLEQDRLILYRASRCYRAKLQIK